VIYFRLFKEYEFPKKHDQFNLCRILLLSPLRARQVYRKASLHPPVHPLTAAIKKEAMHLTAVFQVQKLLVLQRSQALKYYEHWS
jgi:hypothetical protein